LNGVKPEDNFDPKPSVV